MSRLYTISTTHLYDILNEAIQIEYMEAPCSQYRNRIDDHTRPRPLANRFIESKMCEKMIPGIHMFAYL